MSDESFERDIEAALAADDPGPITPGLRARIAGVPYETDGRRRPMGLRFLPLSSPRVSPLVPMAAVLLVVVLAAAGLMGYVRNSTNVGPRASAAVTSGPSASAASTASAIATATTGVSPQATVSTAPSITTPGATSAWTGFTWDRVPDGSPVQMLASPYATRDLVTWDHGYAARGSSSGRNVLLTSPDGETWTPVTAVQEPAVHDPTFIAADPGGLVVVDKGSSGDTIWTSADGKQWREEGPPSGVSDIQSIAGTASGLLATGMVGPNTFGVAFSSDGVSWAPTDFQEGAAWDSMGVYAGQGRFFVVGDNSQTGEGGMWWSDDGRKWTRSSWTGSVAGGIPTIKFTNSGMLSWTTQGIGDSAIEMEVSHDRGKTWLKDVGFGPLGSVGKCPDPATCQSDGYIGSNGSNFLAVNDEGKAWTSSDAITWKLIQWNLSEWGVTTRYEFIVLPRGVLVGQASDSFSLSYGSATQGP